LAICPTLLQTKQSQNLETKYFRRPVSLHKIQWYLHTAWI
jgi:hypothetical protein